VAPGVAVSELAIFEQNRPVKDEQSAYEKTQTNERHYIAAHQSPFDFGVSVRRSRGPGTLRSPSILIQGSGAFEITTRDRSRLSLGVAAFHGSTRETTAGPGRDAHVRANSTIKAAVETIAPTQNDLGS
jgi:hypothetical protein